MQDAEAELSVAVPALPLFGVEEREACLLRTFAKNDFAVLHGLYEETTGIDTRLVVEATVGYFQSLGNDSELLLELLKSVIDREIDSTDVATTLFRSNSAASKLLSLTLKTMGMQYIHSLLQQPVAQICSDPSLHVEIDPRRFKLTDSTEANVAKLTNLCRQFLQRILRSVDECPLFFRKLCNYLQSGVVSKFPESDQIKKNFAAIGGLLFLRFFCPAIFAPKTFGLVKESPSAPALRTLLLVSKVLQMQANGILFTDKNEPYMNHMNSFLEHNASSIVSFFITVATVPDDKELERLERKKKMLSHTFRRKKNLIRAPATEDEDEGDGWDSDPDSNHNTVSKSSVPSIVSEERTRHARSDSLSAGGIGTPEHGSPSAPRQKGHHDEEHLIPADISPLDVLHYQLYKHKSRVLESLRNNPDQQDAYQYFSRVIASFECPNIEAQLQAAKSKDHDEPEQHEDTLDKHKTSEKATEKDKEKTQGINRIANLVSKGMRKEPAPEPERGKSKAEDSDLKKEIEKLQKEKTEEAEKRKLAEKERDNMRHAKELIEKEVVELLHEKQGMKAEVEMWKRAKEAGDLEIMQLIKRNELMIKNKHQNAEEREQENREKEEMKKQKHVADDQIKALINLVETISKERDELTEEANELRERLAAVDKHRALKLRKKLSKYNDGETPPASAEREKEVTLPSESEGDAKPGKSRLKKKAPKNDQTATAERMKEALKLYPHRHNLKRYKYCFNGKQAVDWLIQEDAKAKSRNDAVVLCTSMLSAGFFAVLPGKENVFVDDTAAIFYFSES